MSIRPRPGVRSGRDVMLESERELLFERGDLVLIVSEEQISSDAPTTRGQCGHRLLHRAWLSVIGGDRQDVQLPSYELPS